MFVFILRILLLFVYFLDGVMNEWTVDVDRRIYKGISIGMDRGFVRVNDPIVVVSGMLWGDFNVI